MHCAVGGHLGSRKTTHALLSCIWWPGLSRDVSTFVRGCTICLKPSTKAPAGLLHPVEIPHESFEVWSMDFITDLPLCGGFNGIYTCVDKLTKFDKLIAVSIGEGALSAPEIAHLFFELVVQLFGIPCVVLHDRDACFTANFWRYLWELLGSWVTLSSAYHPQMDGQTECAHRTVE